MRKCTSRKYDYNFTIFKYDCNISYYLLGAFMTDGCIYISKDRPNRKHITLTSKDKDWLEMINNYVCPAKPILKHGKNCFRLMYCSTELADWFISKGCGARKSLTLQFPEVPTQFLPDFIRGCWDGDGSLSFTKSANGGKNYQRQANITSGSLTFCKTLCDKLQKLGIKCKVHSHNQPSRKIENRIINSSNCFRVVLSSGESTYNLCKLLYSQNELSMPRKQKIAQDIIFDWEKEVHCINCDCIINMNKNGHRKIRCSECQRLFINKRNREKYNQSKQSSI